MISTARPWAFSALILLSGCGAADGGESNVTDSGSAGNQAVATPTVGEAVTPAPARSPVHTLTADGIEPGITLGMKQADAVAAASGAFGPAGKTEHNDECGEGPMDFTSFGDLQLAFQDGKLAGWSLSGTKPDLRTKSGLTVGSARSALEGVDIDEGSSLGPEFDADGVGGVLDENGAKVVALWAGDTCQFR